MEHTPAHLSYPVDQTIALLSPEEASDAIHVAQGVRNCRGDQAFVFCLDNIFSGYNPNVNVSIRAHQLCVRRALAINALIERADINLSRESYQHDENISINISDQDNCESNFEVEARHQVNEDSPPVYDSLHVNDAVFVSSMTSSRHESEGQAVISNVPESTEPQFSNVPPAYGVSVLVGHTQAHQATVGDQTALEVESRLLCYNSHETPWTRSDPFFLDAGKK